MISTLYLIGGFILLFYSGKYLVKAGASLAGHFKVSKLVVGVTVVSLGTSAPELLVSLDAALSGHPDMSLGNIIGSNISNIALVLALAAIIFPIPVRATSVKFDWPVMMFASLLFYFFALGGVLQTWQGVLFVVLLIGYVFWSIYKSRKDGGEKGQEIEKPELKIWPSLGLILASSVGLVYGADFLVKGAVDIARYIGISERAISITLVAFGTSVPELATSVIAAAKKETDISIGNIIGSNIFNIFGILGVTAAITPIYVKEIIRIDILFVIAVSFVLFLFILPFKGGKITRWKGAALITIYMGYVFFVINS